MVSTPNPIPVTLRRTPMKADLVCKTCGLWPVAERTRKGLEDVQTFCSGH